MTGAHSLIVIDDGTNILTDDEGRLYGIVSAHDIFGMPDILKRAEVAVQSALHVQRVTARVEVLSKLTPREQQVYGLLMEAENAKSIARVLEISTKTVEFHRRNIFKKLDVEGVPELMRAARLWQS